MREAPANSAGDLLAKRDAEQAQGWGGGHDHGRLGSLVACSSRTVEADGGKFP